MAGFVAELPKRGIAGAALAKWRSAVESFEASLGKAAGRRFGKYEINRFVQQRRVSGASPQEAAFLTAALADYQQWCDAQPEPPAVSAPAAAATAPAAPAAAFRRIELSDQDRAALRRGQLQVLAAIGGVVLLTGGCVANYLHRSGRVRAFSDAVRSEGRRVTGPKENDDLKLRVLALAQEHSMRVGPDDVQTYIGEMSPHKMGLLTQAERMAVMELMQQNRMQQISATREERRRIKEPAPIWYVEVIVRGKVPSLFGGSEFDFENHVAVSEDLPHSSP